VTKREWQIEMANKFAKRDKAEELINAQNTIRQLTAKLECYERLVDANNMASNPMGIKSRVMLREVREMKTIMTKDEEIRKAVEAEREACAKMFDEAIPLMPFAQNDQGGCLICGFTPKLTSAAIRARSKHDTR
jgi:hypothetical protein